MLSEQELDGLFVTNPVSLVYTMGFKTEADTYLMVPAESNSKIQIFASPLEFLLIKSKVIWKFRSQGTSKARIYYQHRIG